MHQKTLTKERTLKHRSQQQRPRLEGPRVNGRIRISPVFVVMGDGTKLGVMPTHLAQAKAEELGVDLVEVSPNARPPVCRLIDYGKYKYNEKKKKNAQKKAQTKIELKTIKLRPKTDTHDIAFKAKAARSFLADGNKVQFEVRFRGRENAHPQTGHDVLNRLMVHLTDVAKLERAARYENRAMTMLVGPK